jgi:hypothetical protein
MATDAQTEMTPAELLHYYLGMRLQSGGRKLPVRQILAEFPEYLRQREKMRGMIQAADEDIAAGRCGPLDLDTVINEVIGELAAKGITE